MPRQLQILVLACLLACGGCRWGCVSKRHNEVCCPTDIRQTHIWCFGEDAVFRGPCGPTSEFYGMRPTTWRAWPTSGADWRDIYNATEESHAWPSEATPSGQEVLPLVPSPTPLSSLEVSPQPSEVTLPQRSLPSSLAVQPPIVVHLSEALPPVVAQQTVSTPQAAPAFAPATPAHSAASPTMSLQPFETQPLTPRQSPTARTLSPESAWPAEFPHLDFGSRSEFAM